MPAALKIAATPHPAQTELRKAIAARDVAHRALEAVQARHDALTAQLDVLAADVEKRRDTFKAAATDDDENATATARKAYRTAVEQHDEAGIILEGIGDRLAAAEKTFEATERDVARHSAAVALILASRTEAEAMRLAAELGAMLARHRRLAQCAAENATAATGVFSEPIDYSSESTPFSRHLDELLHHQPHAFIGVDALLAESIA